MRLVFNGTARKHLAEILLGCKPCAITSTPTRLHSTVNGEPLFRGYIVRAYHRELIEFYDRYFPNHCKGWEVFYAGIAVRPLEPLEDDPDKATTFEVAPFVAVACKHFEHAYADELPRIIELLRLMARVAFNADISGDESTIVKGDYVGYVEASIMALSTDCEELAAAVYMDLPYVVKSNLYVWLDRWALRALRAVRRLVTPWMRRTLFPSSARGPDHAVLHALSRILSLGP